MEDVTIKVLPARYGDCLIFRYLGNDGKCHNIVIDGGLKRTYKEFLKKELVSIKARNENVDLLVVTHIDQDHINGVIAFYEDKLLDKGFVSRVWYNSGNNLLSHFSGQNDPGRSVSTSDPSDEDLVGFRAGNTLECYLQKGNAWTGRLIHTGQCYDLHGARIDILSPAIEDLKRLNEGWQTELNFDFDDLILARSRDYDKGLEELAAQKFEEDDSVPNQSSIAFLLTLNNCRFLFAADALSSRICSTLRSMCYSWNNKLKVEYWKLSHHGSAKNTGPDLLGLIDCQNFIISTNGGRHGLPNKETLARIILHEHRSGADPVRFFFNYDEEYLKNMLSKTECERYKAELVFPEGYAGLEINYK